MLKRIALPRLVSGLALACAFVFVMSRTLHANPLSIVATAECTDSRGFVITYAAFGNPNAGLTNPSVNILFDNVVVDNGAFENPSYSFSNTLPAPAGKGAGATVTVSLLVVGTWSDGKPADFYYSDASTTVTLPADTCNPGTGRFTGGGKQITIGDGIKVTRGLTIHCDLLLSNNLEVNWANGNKFHMLEHLTTLECSDDPNINQNPPPAPIDTLVGVGTGRYNGQDGYTIEFTLVDAGEPGRDDEMAIKIYETAHPSNVVLNVPLQLLTAGNLQAHADQPHKNK